MSPGATRETDHELVAKSLQGNEKAFRTILERYHATAYSVVRGIMGDRHEVEDVVQQVYVKIYRGLPRFRGDSKLSTWIYQIARNEALNAVSRKQPVFTPVEDLNVAAPETASPDRLYGEREAKDRLEDAMAGLDNNFKMALELRYMGEHSYEEIAEIMAIPIGTVKTYIYRGKAELKRVVSRGQLPSIKNGNP